MKFHTILILSSIVMLSCTNQQDRQVLRADNSDLKVGSPVNSSLKKHIADTFRVNLENGALVYGNANQLTVDVIVEIYSPNNKKIASFDNPARGPEPYQFTADTAGVYRIVIAPFEENEGNYSLVITSAEPVAKDKEGRIRQLVAASLGGKAESPGVSIAVQQNGKIIYSEGFGYANLEYDIKNTPTTVFHIASVSKQFTAFAIAMLADQGKLSLDDDIRKYLPEMPDFGHVITINHLVHHTSGLRDQWNLLMMAGWRLDDVITQKQIMRVISRQKELNFKPGDEMVYCNTGFTLMAEIVSRVTGESFADWTKKNIFDPLGMKNTLFYDDHEKIVKNRAYSYYASPAGFKKSVLSYANAGATSLFTTVEDLSLWAINFEKMTVGNQDVMNRMSQRFVLNNGDTITYAFGQGITKYKGLNTASHGGGDAGYRTFLLRFPDQHFSVSVFSNLASFNPGKLSYDIAELYLGNEMKEEKPKQDTPSQNSPQAEEEPFDPAAVKLNEFIGTYYSEELQSSYTLTIKNDTLVAQHQRHDELKMIPVKTDAFTSNFLGNIQFVRDQAKHITGMKASNGRVRNLVFVKN